MHHTLYFSVRIHHYRHNADCRFLWSYLFHGGNKLFRFFCIHRNFLFENALDDSIQISPGIGNFPPFGRPLLGFHICWMQRKPCKYEPWLWMLCLSKRKSDWLYLNGSKRALNTRADSKVKHDEILRRIRMGQNAVERTLRSHFCRFFKLSRTFSRCEHG